MANLSRIRDMGRYVGINFSLWDLGGSSGRDGVGSRLGGVDSGYAAGHQACPYGTVLRLARGAEDRGDRSRGRPFRGRTGLPTT